MKYSKVLGLLIAVIQIVSAIALILGMQSMLGVFSTALPSEEQEIEIQKTDPVVIPFNLTPRNNGYLEATMDVSVSMIVNGTEVANDSRSVIIPAGSFTPVDLELTMPLGDAQDYFERSDLQFKTDIKVTSLYNLISFSNHMVIEGGAQ